MACCVVLNRLPVDIRFDDSAEKASDLSSSSRLQSGLNPDVQDSLNGPSAPTNDSRHISTDGRKTTEAFKEPWSRVLLQAKERSKRNTKKTTIQENHSEQKTTVAGKETTPDEIISSENQSSGSASLVEEKNDLPANCQQNARSGRERRPRRASCPSKKKSKRASSVEWDWSGSDSAGKPEVPQNKKKKAAMKQKRSASLDRTSNKDNSDSEDEDKSPSSKKLNKHKCHLCHKTFPRPGKLRSHLYSHLAPKDRPFCCDEEGCNKTYSYQQHLERHKSSSHSDLVIAVGNILCTVDGCGKVLATASGFKRHMKKLHSEEAFKFACPHCEQKFSKSKQLRYHIAEHDGQPPLRCKQCDVGAYSDAELKRHMRTHKTYSCKISGCEKVFTNYPAMQKHKAEHNRCFSTLCCAHCDKQFSTKKKLLEHIVIHLDNRTIFTCPYESCSRYYYHERNLKGHIRVRHEKISKFTCNWEGCDKLFHSKRAYTIHTNVHQFGIATMVKRKEGPRARRKDAGKPKRSMATLLTGMKVPREMEQELLENENAVELRNSSVEDTSSNSYASDYTATRNLLNASNLKADLQAKHCQTESSVPKDKQPNDSEKICNEMDSANIACDEQIKNVTESTGNPLPEDDICVGTTPLIVEGSENLVPGKIFVVGEDGILMEVQDSPEIPDQVNSKPKETILDEATDIPQDQCLQKVSGKESVASHQNSIVADQTAQCKLNVPTPNQSSVRGNAGLFSDQTCCADSVVETMSNGETCILSATLCAETIVECQSSNAEREVLLVIPKAGQITSIDEVFSVVSSDAVMKALSGDVEVYSVAEKNNFSEVLAGTSLDQQNDNHQEPLKKISINDPSVSSILQPLIENLVNQPEVEDISFGAGLLVTGDDGNVMKSCSLSRDTPVEIKTQNAPSLKSVNNERLKKSEASQINSSVAEELNSNLHTSRKSLQTKSTIFLNPAYLHNPKNKKVDASGTKSNICKGQKRFGCPELPRGSLGKPKIMNPAYVLSIAKKFAGLMCNAGITGGKESVKHKESIPVKKSLQGPTQDLPESGESSASELDDSRSDDSGSDDNDDLDDDQDNNNDHASDGGNGDDEEEEEEEDEDDSEEQVDEEDDEDEDEGEEEEDDENDGDNGGAGQLNGGNDDNNNNDGDNNEGDSDGGGSDKEIDPVLRNGHCTLAEGSDFGVDRMCSPRPVVFDDSDAGRSAQSDDLVIVEESESEACLTMNNEEEIVIREHAAPKTTPPKEHGMNECVHTNVKMTEDILSQLEENASLCESLEDTHLKGMSEKSPPDHISTNNSSLNENPTKSTPTEKNQSKDCCSERNLSKSTPAARNSFKDDILKDVPQDALKNGPSDKDSFINGASEVVLSKGSPKEKSSKVCDSKQKLSKRSTFREVLSKDSPPESRSSPVKSQRRSTRIRYLEAAKIAQQKKSAAAVEGLKKVLQSRQSKRQQKSASKIAEENSGDLNEDDTDGRDSYDSAQIKERKQMNHQRSAKGKDFTAKGKDGSKSKRKMEMQDSTKENKSYNLHAEVSSDSEPLSIRLKKRMPSTNLKAKNKVSNVVESDSSDFEPRPKKKKVLEKDESSKSDLVSVQSLGVKSNFGHMGESEKIKPKQKVKKGIVCISSSSESDIPHPKRMLKQALSDTEDSDELENFDFNNTDSDDPIDPSWKPGGDKKKTDGDSDTDSSEGSSESPQKLAKPLHISIQGPDQGLTNLKVSSASPSRDPLRVQYEGALQSLQERKPIACKQLSESAWISVLRLASKTIKLSPSAADD